MPAATDEGCRFSGVFGFHDLLQPLHGIDHPLAGLVFSISQSTKSSAARQSSGRDIGRVVVKVLEMVILFEHRSFAATLLILGGVHRARWFRRATRGTPFSIAWAFSPIPEPFSDDPFRRHVRFRMSANAERRVLP
jgi:hypothetical protein